MNCTVSRRIAFCYSSKNGGREGGSQMSESKDSEPSGQLSSIVPISFGVLVRSTRRRLRVGAVTAIITVSRKPRDLEHNRLARDSCTSRNYIRRTHSGYRSSFTPQHVKHVKDEAVLLYNCQSIYELITQQLIQPDKLWVYVENFRIIVLGREYRLCSHLRSLAHISRIKYG